jgi:hypothetical protein
MGTRGQPCRRRGEPPFWKKGNSYWRECRSHGNQTVTHTVRAGITSSLTKLSIGVIVKGKTTRAESALGEADAPLWASGRTQWARMKVVAMWCGASTDFGS